MTRIESEVSGLDSSVENIFIFLSNANNHRDLMPLDIKDWNATEDSCTFSIPKLGPLHLEIFKKEAGSVFIRPVGKTPFSFTITWETGTKAEHISYAKLMIDADLNPFIKMMAVGPLQQLADFQTKRLKEIFSS